jgi:predicted amidohydrolase/ribosomal protein S18 acetylase RimI-like enzyme
MQEIDVSRFERRISVRRMREKDFDAVVALQERAFPGMRPWKREQLANHIRIFPEGQLVVEYEGRVIGSASCLVVDFEEYDTMHSFSEITEGGSLENHDPEGENLYGVEVMVDPDYRNMRVGRRLYEARKRLAERLNLRSIIIAGRMPGYGKHADKMSPAEYVRQVQEKRVYDPVLTFQMNNGFVVKRVIPDYLPRDGESRGNAVLMEWNNIDYRPKTRRHLKTSFPVRICVIQYQMRKVEGFDDFAEQCEYFVDVAAHYASDFAVFPELLTTQLLSFLEEKSPTAAARELAGYTDRYVELFRGLAVRYNINIIAGTHFVTWRDEQHGESLHNVAFLFRRDGTIGKQYKIHVTHNERQWWGTQPGDVIRVFDTDVGKIGIQVCYDVEFPEMARIQTDLGARIIFVPFCTEDRQAYLRVRYCAQARAIENQVYVVVAGTVGNLPETENMDVQYAQSAVFTPSDFPFPRDGIASECTPNVETVIVSDVDLEVLRRHRRSGTVMQLRDRRHDLYQTRVSRKARGELLPSGESASETVPPAAPVENDRQPPPRRIARTG